MLNIILCDDDKFILQLASEHICEEIAKKRLEAQIVCKSVNSMDIFQYVKNNRGDYLVFLDLDFGEGRLNGIDVAKRLKELSSGSKIVFVTNHQEMAMKVLASGVEPFGFLEKSTNMKRLSEGYGRYMQMAAAALEDDSEDQEEIKLVIGIDEEVAVKKRQILYVESEKTVSHGISYHTMDGSCITVRDTIENIAEQLGAEFGRVHRSFLANKKHVVGLAEGRIKLSNGDEIPCAVRMRNEVRKWLG